MVGGSVSFDNAADIYDDTRAIPPEATEKRTEALLTELRALGSDRLLEVGIGTGRIARPLMERGVRVTGVDLAPRMMQRLRDQLTPRHTAPDLALADATRLPFRSDAFHAILIVHVLHLVSDWRGTVAEMLRVLAPGGVFFHDITQHPEPNPLRAAWDARKALFKKHGVVTRLRPDPEEIVQALEAAGGSQRVVDYAEVEERDTVRSIVDNLRNRIDSSTWEIPSDIHDAFTADFEESCRQEFGDLDQEYAVKTQYTLEVWTFA